MFENVICEELDWGGGCLKLEVGRLARQATAAVYASFGPTTLLATVVVDKVVNPELNFVPLSVFYNEKSYSAGRIPGGFFKREGKPSENEVLTSRLIDRPLRPLFDKDHRQETQVMVNLLSYDTEVKPDFLAIIAASAALSLCGVPFQGPVGAARVGYVDGGFVLNPSREQLKSSALDLVVAGTQEGVLMVESEAKELTEEEMLSAVMFGHESFQPVIEMIHRLVERVGKAEVQPLKAKSLSELLSQEDVSALVGSELEAAYSEVNKTKRQEAVSVAKERAVEHFLAAHHQNIAHGEITRTALLGHLMGLLKEVERDIVRGQILKTGLRIDGRDLKTVRPIDCAISFLPRAHGSALFTRGETQALVATTLGSGDDEQRIDSLEGEYKETFMLHYNFPSFSVGEVGRPGSVGRREVGHGKLAWRAIHPLLPAHSEFPHTLRVVSEILESNGSSSMATVCGASLSLMDACVPLKRPVSGIAMGLIKEGEEFAVLSDILGDEDNLGDMDFKVAGTSEGITALQMDIKITSISRDIMRLALEQAKEGRIHILGEMSKAMSKPRDKFKDHMPRVETITIPKEKIREVIGAGGKVIREITDKTGAKIDISDSGLIKISSSNSKAIEEAIEWIKRIVKSDGRSPSKDEPQAEEGRIYDGTVVKIMRYGAFVSFLGSRDGLVHVSEISSSRVENVEDVLNEGDKVKVKVIGFDDQGKVRLSMKRVDQETGEDIDDESMSDTRQGRSRSSSSDSGWASGDSRRSGGNGGGRRRDGGGPRSNGGGGGGRRFSGHRDR